MTEEEKNEMYEFFFMDGKAESWKVDFDNFKENLLEIAHQIELFVDFPPFQEFEEEIEDFIFLDTEEEVEERASELYSLSQDILERSFSRIASELREIAEKF